MKHILGKLCILILFVYALQAQSTLAIFTLKANKKEAVVKEAIYITVTKPDIATLVDAKESPQTKHWISVESIENFFSWIVIFVAGFFSAKLLEKLQRKKLKTKRFEDIQKASTPQQLIVLLLGKYKHCNLDDCVVMLEKLEYEKSATESFASIKKRVLSKLASSTLS